MEEKEKGLSLDRTRRDFLKAAGIFSLAATLGGTRDLFLPTWASGAEPVKIGHVIPLTGFLAMTGSYGDLGAKLAVEELLFIRSTLTAEQLNRMKQIRERWAARAQQRQQEEQGGRARRNRRAGEHGVRPPPPPPGAPAAPERPPEGGPEDLPR